MTKDVSPVKKGTTDVAKLAVSISSGVAGVFFPGAGLVTALFSFAIDKYIKRSEKLLLQELKKGNLAVLADDKAATFIPMAYRGAETSIVKTSSRTRPKRASL